MDITDVLPKECISTIISFTSPKDAARISVVSSFFKAVADSDDVWETYLPSDFEDIIVKPLSRNLSSLSKKDLFLHLCDHPIPISYNNMSLVLDKDSGKKCFKVGAKRLEINWEENPVSWNWNCPSRFRFHQLEQRWVSNSLEVKGRIVTRLLSQNTTYAVFLVCKFNRWGSGGLHRPMDLTVEYEGSENGSHKRMILSPSSDLVRHKGNRWMELEMGEFVNEDEDNHSVICRLFHDNIVKDGLIIKGIEFRPKHNV
ncbi:hypothetical protein L6164_016628 [Bauhinia variegata]|uniref:Uncharacterized protein n=1 Tax=Bauhinia variegata TaxID=167791 RepID=A0ACB9NQJ5_BAUVA|nr:hypothetical protein L6164_016628 [Bauhinia variegata]